MVKAWVAWVGACVVSLSPAASHATETLTATFDTPTGGVTVGEYYGIVKVRVSGVGESLFSLLNDAFYLAPTYGADQYSLYQLGFGTSPLMGNNPADDAVNFLVGGPSAMPAYEPDHAYTIDLNTGLTTPGHLYFGVTDSDYSDNSGEFLVTIEQLPPEPSAALLAQPLPEPGDWALMLIGLGTLGATLRRRAGLARAVAR
jgi:hypothetical protein